MYREKPDQHTRNIIMSKKRTVEQIRKAAKYVRAPKGALLCKCGSVFEIKDNSNTSFQRFDCGANKWLICLWHACAFLRCDTKNNWIPCYKSGKKMY